MGQTARKAKVKPTIFPNLRCICNGMATWQVTEKSQTGRKIALISVHEWHESKGQKLAKLTKYIKFMWLIHEDRQHV